MRSPFPGMDPFIESPVYWSDFHATFVPALREAINAVLPPNYVARIDEELVLLNPELSDHHRVKPDVTVTREPYAGSGAGGASAAMTLSPVTLDNIQLLDPITELFIEVVRKPERDVVTVVEVLSPTNKVSEGRGLYLEKRNRLLRRPVNIVELDLLRAGQRIQLNRPLPAGQYYAFVSRGDRRPKCDVFAWGLRDPLPALPIPLKAPDGDVQVDLARAFTTAYDRGGYRRQVDYLSEPYGPPRFDDPDDEWVMQTARSGATTS